MKKHWGCLFLIVFVICVADFIATAGITWVFCWAFDFAFRWRYAIAVFLLHSVAVGLFNPITKRKVQE